jgi:hypothetical protein
MGIWSLTLRNTERVWVLQMMQLTRLFGPQREEAILRWEKVRVEDFHDL